MNATLISLRAVRRSSMMLFGALTLAACDNDRTVGPSLTDVSKSSPKAASGARLSTSVGRAAWAVRDMAGNLVGGAVFTWNDGSGPVMMVDNSALDLDPTPGLFAAAAPTGNSGICPISGPKGYVFPAGVGCVGIPIPPGQTTFVATFAINHEFSAYWSTASDRGLVGPATYTVKSKATRFLQTIVDNGANDVSSELGRLLIKLPAGGDYEVCMTKAAPGTKLATPACSKISVVLGEPKFAGVFYSAGN